MALVGLKDCPARAFRASYQNAILNNFEIWPFWDEIGPFRGMLGPQITPFCGNFPRSSAQAIFATKEKLVGM
jgi:hypothetical protein